MKFKLIESSLLEGKNIDKTWDQYKDRIIAQIQKDNPNAFRRISDMPFTADGDGYEDMDQEDTEAQAKHLWINNVLSIDPTMEKAGDNSTGDFGIWLTNRFLSDEINHWTDVEKIKNDLKDFMLKKANLENKDINSYKSVKDLEKVLNNTQLTPRQVERHRRNAYGDAKFIYGDDVWDVYQVTTYDSACTLGKGTNWCTAYSNDESYYISYIHDGALYVIINRQNPSEKYQLFIPDRDRAEDHFGVEMHDKNDSDMHGNENATINVDEFLNLSEVTSGLRNLLEELGIHQQISLTREEEVQAVMEVYDVDEEEARQNLEDGEVEVIPGIYNDSEYGTYILENYGFDESLEDWVDWGEYGNDIIKNVYGGNIQKAFDDLEMWGNLDAEHVGMEYYNTKHISSDELFSYINHRSLGYDDRENHLGRYTRCGLVLQTY